MIAREVFVRRLQWLPSLGALGLRAGCSRSPSRNSSLVSLPRSRRRAGRRLLQSRHRCLLHTHECWRAWPRPIVCRQCSTTRRFVRAGALMSYGPDIPAAFRRMAELVVKVARGARLADIPIEQATKFILAFNQTAAASLGLPLSPLVMASVDELIV